MKSQNGVRSGVNQDGAPGSSGLQNQSVPRKEGGKKKVVEESSDEGSSGEDEQMDLSVRVEPQKESTNVATPLTVGSPYENGEK